MHGETQTLPNPDLFVARYVRQEAILSSQTQSTLDDLLDFELDPRYRMLAQDVEEVVTDVQAVNYGHDRPESLALSPRLVREIHGELLANIRGAELSAGEFS